MSAVAARTLPSGDRSRPIRVLIIIQNLWVPFDRRVWLECQALRRAGYQVSVVCPRGPGDGKHKVLDAGDDGVVHVYQYKGFPPITSKLAFPLEYLWSFFWTACLVAKARRRQGFDIIQTCNPPDIFWPIGAFCKAFFGTRFVFDQHDLCPELYESRFPDGPSVLHKLLLFSERLTYRTADHVISTNESYKARALGRGRKHPGAVTVVRTGPDPDALRRSTPDPALRRGRAHMVCYIGVMGPQDGVDLAVRAAHVLKHEMGRHDVQFTFMGGGDCFEALKALAIELGVDDICEFTGRVPDETVKAIMSSAEVGLCPDPKNPLNDVSTMNKTMEYMAYELPVVAFDLAETKVSAGIAALYARANDVTEYAKAIVFLLDDPERRERMGAYGRRRVEERLAWAHQERNYLSVYAAVSGLAKVRVA